VNNRRWEIKVGETNLRLIVLLGSEIKADERCSVSIE
jgi:hypothetical protein